MQVTGGKSFREGVALLFRARFPVLYIESFEEQRVLAEVGAVSSDSTDMRTVRPMYVWNAVRGFVDPDGAEQHGTATPTQALEWLLDRQDAGVFVMLDLHAHLGDELRAADPVVVRLVREVSMAFQSGSAASAKVLIIVAPQRRIPRELEKDITLVDFPLPSEKEIRLVLDKMIAANCTTGRLKIDIDDAGRERLAKAATGLTLSEAINAFARAMADDGVLAQGDVHVVMEEKKQAVRKAGLLEFVDVSVDLDGVGGLQNLKRWLDKRNGSWLDEAAEYGLPAAKGVLVTGMPGCGKSLTAKAVAAAWGLPLLRLDIGKVFSGLVGASEQNMRSAIQAVEAAAPCVLWLDEIEKGFSGVIGRAGDSGTSSRVFGTFLTWMQEKTASVFVIATANNVDTLPPELLRKGRFDEIFFVDLPTARERRDIWSLHLAKHLRNNRVGRLNATDQLLAELADSTAGYSGAEIEQIVISGLFEAFAERRPLRVDDLKRTAEGTIPLSVTQAEQITALRRWAANRAVPANGTEDRPDHESTMPGRSAQVGRGGPRIIRLSSVVCPADLPLPVS